jgi:hypothetical protein
VSVRTNTTLARALAVASTAVGLAQTGVAVAPDFTGGFVVGAGLLSLAPLLLLAAGSRTFVPAAIALGVLFVGVAFVGLAFGGTVFLVPGLLLLASAKLASRTKS